MLTGDSLSALHATYDVFCTKTNDLATMAANEESFADSKLARQQEDKGHIVWRASDSTPAAPLDHTAYIFGRIAGTDEGTRAGCRGNKITPGSNGEPIIVCAQPLFRFRS